MIPRLLDRLRQDLPADWQQAEPAKWGEAWYADPVRTVYLAVGDNRLFVSARAKGAISGPIGGGQRSMSWRDLRRSICEGVARLALDYARCGLPVPKVPPWALPALHQGAAKRRFAIGMEDELARQTIARLAAESALIIAATETT